MIIIPSFVNSSDLPYFLSPAALNHINGIYSNLRKSPIWLLAGAVKFLLVKNSTKQNRAKVIGVLEYIEIVGEYRFTRTKLYDKPT